MGFHLEEVDGDEFVSIGMFQDVDGFVEALFEDWSDGDPVDEEDEYSHE